MESLEIQCEFIPTQEDTILKYAKLTALLLVLAMLSLTGCSLFTDPEDIISTDHTVIQLTEAASEHGETGVLYNEGTLPARRNNFRTATPYRPKHSKCFASDRLRIFIETHKYQKFIQKYDKISRKPTPLRAYL